MSLANLTSVPPALPTMGALAVLLLLWTLNSFFRKRSASPNPQAIHPDFIPPPDHKAIPPRSHSPPEPTPPSTSHPSTDPPTKTSHPGPTVLLPWRASFSLVPPPSSNNTDDAKCRSSSVAARKGSVVPPVLDEECAGRGGMPLVSPRGRGGEEDLFGVGDHLWFPVDGEAGRKGRELSLSW
ncbi:hypothetical protein B0T18DRAFT_75843 [Schizothecium vesticola]|uniref:Uncharacterized protein n=1 Tax=Schizothecium vesticola TaxID=314040 RepID=A0AA40F5S6_9PEZI|nr:hypothetical protein B0T18DRAFT_75843 [Schizothecium vesticola]